MASSFHTALRKSAGATLQALGEQIVYIPGSDPANELDGTWAIVERSPETPQDFGRTTVWEITVDAALPFSDQDRIRAPRVFGGEELVEMTYQSTQAADDDGLRTMIFAE